MPTLHRVFSKSKAALGTRIIAMSYSNAVSQNLPAQSIQQPPANSSRPENTTPPARKPDSARRSPSPNAAYMPKTASQDEEEESVYVLTLLTSKALHDRMTGLRNKYFPPKLNKLAAHLTLFHALPGSKLESHIVPTLIDVASSTKAFPVSTADHPFRLKTGIGISVAGGKQQCQHVHGALQQAWLQEGFLSDQDASKGFRPHYTIMNKVTDDIAVGEALQEVKKEFGGEKGVCEGLGLWRYEYGKWKWVRKFRFDGS